MPKKRATSSINGLRNDMYKRTFYKERKVNNRCFDFLSKQNTIVPLIFDINEFFQTQPTVDKTHHKIFEEQHVFYSL